MSGEVVDANVHGADVISPAENERTGAFMQKLAQLVVEAKELKLRDMDLMNAVACLDIIMRRLERNVKS